jgi:AcrR family transcriptional regulator
MRVKTEDRRQAIMEAALAAFREVGYERASMSGIAARLGGSKATLYSYFKSKEDLYATAILEESLEIAEGFLEKLDPDREDIRAVLEEFGTSYLHFVNAPDLVGKKRHTLSQGVVAALGPILYERGPKYAWSRVAAYLDRLMGKGALRPCDPDVAAMHLQGLLEAGVVEPILYDAPPRLSIESAAPLAVDAFLRAYAAPSAA